MRIPLMIRPESDELLYGWLVRIARLNMFKGVDAVGKLLKGYLRLSRANGKLVNVTYDGINNLVRFCDVTRDDELVPDLKKILSQMNTFYAKMPLLTAGDQARSLEMRLYDRPDFVSLTDLPSHIKNLRFCPECVKEDESHSVPYLHVWHQLPGVTMCAKHGCRLVELPYKTPYFPGMDIINDAKTVSSVTGDDEKDFRAALFMKELYNRPVFVNYSDTKRAIREYIGLGKRFTQSSTDYFRDYLLSKGYGEFIAKTTDFTKLLTDRYPIDYLPYPISAVFDDCKDFKDILSTICISEEDDLKSEIAGKFEALSDYGPLMRFKCLTCGKEFYAHPHSILTGDGCPECDKTLSRREYVNKRMSYTGDGNYVLLKDPKYIGRPTDILHKTCGKIKHKIPSKIVYDGSRCNCERSLSEDDIQKRVDAAAEGFTLMEIDREARKIRLRHDTCGRGFWINLLKFEQSPYCRVCANDEELLYKEIKEKISMITGDEYEIIGKYKNYETKIQFLHKKCGTISNITLYDFLNGWRCSLCSPKYEADFMMPLIKESLGEGFSYESLPRSYCIVTFPDGHKIKTDTKKVMQEITRPTESEMFPRRQKIINQPVSDASILYCAIRKECEQSGIWIKGEEDIGLPKQKLEKLLYWLNKNGYIKNVDVKCYCLASEIPKADDIIRERYIKRHGVYKGIWCDESAAYECGIISDTPNMKHLKVNGGSHWKKPVCGSMIKITKPYVEVTNENYRAILTLNMLLYVVDHMEFINKARKYCLRNCPFDAIAPYISFYPARINNVLKIIYR